MSVARGETSASHTEILMDSRTENFVTGCNSQKSTFTWKGKFLFFPLVNICVTLCHSDIAVTFRAAYAADCRLQEEECVLHKA